MYKIEIAAEITEDKKFVLDNNQFKSLIALMDSGNYILTLTKEIEPKTIEEFRAEYFAKRDIVASETGNSKKDVHEGAKNKLIEGRSTTTLSLEEWRKFIDDFKEWGFEIFNCYL